MQPSSDECASLEHVNHPDTHCCCICKTSSRSGSGRARSKNGLLQDYLQFTCHDDNLLAVLCVGWLVFLRELPVITAFKAVWPKVQISRLGAFGKGTNLHFYKPLLSLTCPTRHVYGRDENRSPQSIVWMFLCQDLCQGLPKNTFYFIAAACRGLAKNSPRDHKLENSTPDWESPGHITPRQRGRVDSAGCTCCALSSVPASYPCSVMLRNCRELPDTVVKSRAFCPRSHSQIPRFPSRSPYCSLELQCCSLLLS